MPAEYLYLKNKGIACLVYDAVTCGRSEMDPAKRMFVRDMMWLPNDVEAFYQVGLQGSGSTCQYASCIITAGVQHKFSLNEVAAMRGH